MIDIVSGLRRIAEEGYRFAGDAADEIERLRAKVAEMERQVPICRAEDLKHAESLLPTLGLKPENPLYALPGAQQCKNCNGMGDRFDPSGEKIPCDLCESHLEEIRSLVAEAAHAIISGSDFWLSISLAAKKIYALPGAQPAPSEQDASVRKAWARFSHELHRSPDAPYPGMADAFEQHFSQSFIDREWRAEAATWAAAWKAAKRHCVEYASVGEIADAVVDLIVKGEGK